LKNGREEKKKERIARASRSYPIHLYASKRYANANVFHLIFFEGDAIMKHLTFFPLEDLYETSIF